MVGPTPFRHSNRHKNANQYPNPHANDNVHAYEHVDEYAYVHQHANEYGHRNGYTGLAAAAAQPDTDARWTHRHFYQWTASARRYGAPRPDPAAALF
jgi:hypothetical protein